LRPTRVQLNKTWLLFEAIHDALSLH
jgi:hypothetical protein